MEGRGLTEKQLRGVDCVAAGMPPADVAIACQVSVGSVHRWLRSERFADEVARRKECQALDGTPLGDAANPRREWDLAVREHLATMRQISRLTATVGREALEKAQRRLEDLPDEALKPADAIALARLGADLLNSALDTNTDLLGIAEIADRLLGEGG